MLKPSIFAGLIGTTPRKKKAQQRQQSRCAFANQVEKINLKWDVIAKQQELDLASAQEAAATAAEKTACDEAIPIVCADSTTEACTNAMAQLSGEAPATPPVTTTPGPTKSPIVDTRLGYNNKVQLPGAEAANPFSDSTAERTERIGGKFGMASGYRDLTSSLREHLVPGASVAQEVRSRQHGYELHRVIPRL